MGPSRLRGSCVAHAPVHLSHLSARPSERSGGGPARSNLVKGVPLAAVLLAYWFAASEARERRREIIVATFGAAASAIVLGRLLAHLLPFRVRPVHDAALGFVPPFGRRSPSSSRTARG